MAGEGSLKENNMRLFTDQMIDKDVIDALRTVRYDVECTSERWYGKNDEYLLEKAFMT